MKKLIYILTFIFLISFSQVFAAEKSNCSTTSWPSSKLSAYFSDVKTILWELQKTIWESKCEWETSTWFIAKSTAGASKWYDKIIASTNSLTDFQWFYSSWELDIYPIFKWWLPNAIYRDHDYIIKQNTLIDNVIVAAWQKCALDKEFSSDTINKKFEQYGIVKQTKLWDSLVELKKFNIKVSNYFRCSIAWTMWECKLEWNKGLESDITSNYFSNIDNCVEKEASFKKIWESIKNVFDWNYWLSSIKNSLKDWKDAISLLRWDGYDNKSYSEIERSLLSKELSRQWLPWNWAAAVLSNLECMNNADKTLINCIWENIKRYRSPFVEKVDELLSLDYKKSKTTNDVPDNIFYTKQYEAVVLDVETDFANQKMIISQYNKVKDKWVADLINLHYNLVETNNKVSESVKTSQKLCNMQATGVGNCNANKAN